MSIITKKNIDNIDNLPTDILYYFHDLHNHSDPICYICDKEHIDNIIKSITNKISKKKINNTIIK